MPFGMTNAPATFQNLMNDILRPLLNVCVLVYIDDILIYSETIKLHDAHLRSVLTLLREHQLYAKLSKCKFYQDQIEYLGHIISGKGIQVDNHKVQALQDFPIPTTLKLLQ
jgi:hypothetical protein